MGDIADMMIEGILCQECGVLIEDDEACGYPRFCRSCGGDPDCNYAVKKRPKKTRSKKTVPCPECGKKFRTADGMKEHRKVVHA